MARGDVPRLPGAFGSPFRPQRIPRVTAKRCIRNRPGGICSSVGGDAAAMGKTAAAIAFADSVLVAGGCGGGRPQVDDRRVVVRVSEHAITIGQRRWPASIASGDRGRMSGPVTSCQLARRKPDRYWRNCNPGPPSRSWQRRGRATRRARRQGGHGLHADSGHSARIAR